MLRIFFITPLYLISCGSKNDKYLINNNNISSVKFVLSQNSQKLKTNSEEIYIVDTTKDLNIYWERVNNPNLFCNIGVITISDWNYALPMPKGKFNTVNMNFQNSKNAQTIIPANSLEVGNKFSLNLFCLKSQSKTELIAISKDNGNTDKEINSNSIIMLKHKYQSQALGKPIKLESK